MSKKIVILNGSPRKTGNTAALIRSFAEGAESAGNTVTEFFLDGMDLHGCRGCFGGGRDPEHPCVQRDDMDKIYPVYKEADVVVLASPLYYWTISGQLKLAFDRLFAVAECDPGLANPKRSPSCLWRRRATALRRPCTGTTTWNSTWAGKALAGCCAAG